MLERQPEVIVVKWRRVAVNDEQVVSPSCNHADRHAGYPLDQIDDLRLDTIDHIDLTALERGGASCCVVDHNDLDLVGMA